MRILSDIPVLFEYWYIISSITQWDLNGAYSQDGRDGEKKNVDHLKAAVCICTDCKTWNFLQSHPTHKELLSSIQHHG